MSSDFLTLFCTCVSQTQVVKNGSTFNGKPLIMKWYTPKITPKISLPTSGSMHTSSPVSQHRQLPFTERSTPVSPTSDEPVRLSAYVTHMLYVTSVVHQHSDGVSVTLSGLAIT